MSTRTSAVPANSVNSVNSVGWERPIPLGEIGPVPAFPASALPAVLREWVVAVAQATQTPLDLAAALSLAVVALAVSRGFFVRVRPGWTEVLVLYVAVALPSGERKSPVFAAATRVLFDYERTRRRDLAAKVREACARRAVVEREIQQAMKRGDAGEIANVRERLDGIVVPANPRLVVDDVTPEKLAVIMAEQGGRVGVFSDEGGIFETLAGRYSGGVPNIDLFLKGHSGTPVRVDRKSSESICIDRPTITCGFAVQPDVLRTLANKPGFRGRGLVARFCFLLPQSTVGSRAARSAPVAGEVTEAYENLIRDLLGESDLIADLGDEPRAIALEAAADELLAALQEEIEPHLVVNGELEALGDWVGKFVGTVARIAGLIHAVEHPESPSAAPVTAETVQRASSIGKYLLQHARAAFALMGADPDVERAKRIVHWILQKGIRRFSLRDVMMAMRAHFPRAALLDGPLRVLVEHHFVRPIDSPPRPGRGRPPSQQYEVSPLVAAHKSHNSQNGDDERAAIREHGGG